MTVSLYASKLGLKIYFTNVGAQNINGFILETFRMVLASFQVEDKLGRARFFQESFLLTDTCIEVVLDMPYLTLSNADKDLTWRSYTAAEALFTIKRVELIDKKEFAKPVLNENVEAFVVHVISLSFNLLKRRWRRMLKLLWCT